VISLASLMAHLTELMDAPMISLRQITATSLLPHDF